MPRGRAWTIAEEQFIAKNRQKMSIVTISAQLGRTPEAVEIHWRRMKKRRKANGSLRHWRPRLVWCGECSAFRTAVYRDGCPVCKARKTLEAKRIEEARLFALLPAESKELNRPQCHGSSKTRKPRPPDTLGMDAYSKRKSEEAYDIAVQRWEIENLRRETRALQKRCERHRKKLNTGE